MGKSDDTKALIIRKAAPIFNTKGYVATSIKDITEATGMTKGAIYGNFKTKEEVAVAVLEYTAKKIFGLMGQMVRAATNAPDKMRAILDFYESYITNPPIEGGCPILNTAIEVDDGNPLLRLKVSRMLETLHTSMFKILHRGIKEGQLKAEIDVEAFGHVFVASLEGAIMIARVQGDVRSYHIIKKQLEKQIDAMSLMND
ncbi:MAG: TetR/AcrR family transcriptional regulator [Bacteroidota bacterium]